MQKKAAGLIPERDEPFFDLLEHLFIDFQWPGMYYVPLLASYFY
jgi:hypothetical protein